MSKKTRSLIISLACVVVLAGVAVGVKFLLDKAPEEEGELPSSELVNVVEGTADDIELVTVQNPTDEYTVIYKLKDPAYEGAEREKVWYIEPLLKSQPVSGSGRTVVDACANINASEKFEDVENLSDYGLEAPQATVRVDYTDGTEMTINLGSAVPAEGGYYMSTDKEPDTVYVLTASSSDVFFQPLTGFLDTHITNYEDQVLANITSFRMSGTLLEEPIEIVKPDEQTEVAKLGFNIYDIVSPVKLEMKVDVTTNLTNALMSIIAEEVVAAVPSEEDLKNFDLLDPQYVLTIEHPDWEGGLTLKTSKVNGVMYVMRNDEPTVFRVNPQAIVWHGWQVEDVMSPMIIMPRLGDLSQIELSLEDMVYQFEVASTLSEEEATKDKMIPTGVTLGGEEIDLENFKLFYQLMLNCIVDSRSEGEPEGQPVLTFVYRYTAGGEDRVEFYKTDNRRLYISLNGNADFYVKDSYYDKVVKELDHLMNDIEVNIDWT